MAIEIKCKICNKEYKNYIGLSSHINHTHKLSSKEYYDKYLRKSDEGICPICGKETKYISISKGYLNTCSTKCSNSSLLKINYTKQIKKERYGDENYNNHEKAKQTCLKKYGVEYITQSVEVKEKIKQTNLQKYGVENPYQSESIKSKIKQTNLDKYGVEYPQRLKEFRRKKEKTNIARYGSICPANSNNQNKSYETKRKNKSFNSSSLENLFKMYLDKYKIKYKTQYNKDKRYPFLCDFYLPEFNIFIEINGFWTHGGHWFDKNNLKDVKKVKIWEEKAKNSNFYTKAIETWTKRDVKKRRTAAENNLNYVVLWNKAEIINWFSCGCPVRQDWK